MSRKRSGWARAAAMIGAGLLVSATGLVGCGGGPPEVKEVRYGLTLVGGEKLNTCGQAYSNALVVHVYQLSSEARISIADLDQLSGDARAELGDDLVDVEEIVLEPGARMDVDILAKPDVAYLAVVGNFCETRGDCWRWIKPVAEFNAAVKLEFGEFCIEGS